MKLLKLTVTDVENVNAEYDFTTGRVDSRENAIRFLKYALFGKDDTLSGKITLEAEYDEEVYKIERDFASDTVLVYMEDYVISGRKAAKILTKLAGLKQEQWEANVGQLDEQAFFEDPTAFVKQYLADLGFDEAELEKRRDFYNMDHAMYVSKVEAYDELVDDSYIAIAADKKVKLQALREKFEVEVSAKNSAEKKEALLAVKHSIAAKKELLLQKAAEIEEKRELLRKHEEFIAKSDDIEAIKSAQKDLTKLQAEFNKTVATVERLQKEIEELQASLNEKLAEAEQHAERANGLRDSFEDILQANLNDGELTDAVVGKTVGIAATVVPEENSLLAELRETHSDYKKQRSLREGVALENSFESAELRISDLQQKIDQNTAVMEKLQEEIAENERLLGEVPAEPTEDVDDEVRTAVYEGRFSARILEEEIEKESDKIRELLKSRKILLEDINALKKAQKAQEEYIRRCEKKKTNLDDKYLESRSRVGFADSRNELEIGLSCPLCNHLVTDRQSLAEDVSNLVEGNRRLAADVESANALYTEAKEKLSDIELRLAQLTERNAQTVSKINELTASVQEKQRRLSKILADNGVKTVPDLERKFRSVPAPTGTDEFTVRSHIEFLQTRYDEIAASVEADRAVIAEEQARLDDMRRDYEESIKPELNGKPALESLDEIIENDIREDAIIASLAEPTQGAHSADGADMYVNLTAEIFANVMAEITSEEKAREKILRECERIRARIQHRELAHADAQRTAEELQAEITALDEGLSSAVAEVGFDEEETKPVLTEKQLNAITAEIKEYDERLTAYEIQIAALEGHDEVEYDKEDLATLEEELEKAEQAYTKAATRLAVSEAAKKLAYENASICGDITEKMENLNKIASGDIASVIMPVINDVFTLSQQPFSAHENESRIDLRGRHNKRLTHADLGADLATLLVNCVINHILCLVSGEETIRFAPLDENVETYLSSAEKYGVIVL